MSCTFLRETFTRIGIGKLKNDSFRSAIRGVKNSTTVYGFDSFLNFCVDDANGVFRNQVRRNRFI